MFHFANRRKRLTVELMFLAALAVSGCGKTAFEASDSSAAPREAKTEGAKPNESASAVKGRFVDKAAAAGLNFRMNFLPNEQGEKFKINLYDHGCGIAVADYDNDGHDDIYFVNQLGPNGLFRNKGDGTFEDVSEAAGVAVGDRICVGVMFADYDNDGDQDLFVTSTRGGNILFQNQGNGKFLDFTEQAGLKHIGHSATASFFDMDNDGLLDLLVTNTAQWTTDQVDESTSAYVGVSELTQLIAAPKEQNLAYHNNGDGTFTDITTKSGLTGVGWGGDIAAFDYDEDGKIDVLITNMFGASQLYRNVGDATFSPVTEQVLGPISWGAIGAKAFDYDNDGRLDLFISDMHSDMWLPWYAHQARDYIRQNSTKKYHFLTGATYKMFKTKFAELEEAIADRAKVDYDNVVFGNTLFKNLGAGRMVETSSVANMETWWPWGVAAADFDCDGFCDVFIPSGMGYPFFYWPNQLMMNNGKGGFVEQAATLGIEPPVGGELQAEKISGADAARSSRCAAVGDFDGDGRLEVVTNNFNDRPYYFHNELPRKNYIAFKLTGTRSNRDAIGAEVRLTIGDEKMVRQVDSAGGYLSQSSKTLHFGLGDRNNIDQAEIRWPSGHVEVIKSPKLNQVHKVTEPKS